MSPGEAFVADLLDAVDTDAARLRLVARLAKYAGQSVYIPAGDKAARRIRAASNMLDNGMAPGDVARAVAARFGVTVRQARRDVSAARQMS